MSGGMEDMEALRRRDPEGFKKRMERLDRLLAKGRRCPWCEHYQAQALYWRRIAQIEREQRLALEREAGRRS